MPVRFRPRAPSLKKRSQIALMRSGFFRGFYFVQKVRSFDYLNRMVSVFIFFFVIGLGALIALRLTKIGNKLCHKSN